MMGFEYIGTKCLVPIGLRPLKNGEEREKEKWNNDSG